jgi:hypothetical protein
VVKKHQRGKVKYSTLPEAFPTVDASYFRRI